MGFCYIYSMSMVTRQWEDYDGEMCCWCPTCGRKIFIDEDDYYQTLDDGNKEYFLYCPDPDCGQGFYASKSYD